MADSLIGINARRTLLTLLVSAAAALTQPHPSRAQSKTRARTCAIRAKGPSALIAAGGRTIYVEPNSFASDGDRVFLAGRPNYVFRGDRLEMRDGIFGVISEWPRPARIVMSPLGLRLASNIRLAPLGRGRWAAVFAELQSGSTFPHDPPLIDLWYAVFDGASWSGLEKIPLPSPGVIRSGPASSLVVTGDTLIIAFPLDSVSASLPQESHVAVFTRSRGRWSVTVVPTWMASYVSLESFGPAGLRLAVVQPDTSLTSDGSSLFLYGPGPMWPNRGKLIAAGETFTHDPILRRGRGDLMVSWHARVGSPSSPFGVARTARMHLASALDSSPIAPLQPVVTFDSNAVQMMQLENSRPRLWITEHVLGEVGGAPQREFRVFAESSGIPVLIGRVADRFDGTLFSTAIVTKPDRLLIAGPSLRRRDDGSAVLVTYVLEFPLGCARR
ncbi:MAG: hypothetical protein M3P26_01995 [Gemmatimonadota bacterium]|nr:hypothetical protein [Gemmatimonadota bacterium]